MHIPDGFLNAQTWAPAYLLSAGAIGYSIKKSREELSERQVPRLGVMAAFIFAAQMVNFPVIAGVASGHLLGAALAAIMLGPWSACIVISTVLAIQMLFFGDGGITALGANMFNMAVIGVLTAYLLYSLLSRLLPGPMGRNVSVFVTAWFSVMASALLASLELGLSHSVHQVSLSFILKGMLGVHALIGIGEGLITVAVVNFMDKIGFAGGKGAGEGVSRS
ncbi:MAG: cobalamin biosynthesis protein CbiM [Peptococcaceae bacterium BICA1-7]|nr:MAG: cobalamin biosynthesis protein CbiM [Peptococcaceae bacterium BICA1-7]HBV98609.1 cobalamin biosynthesis protein CbiM [Desulfotomaculum sp.]